ncbi:MAG: DUF4037 domain-containing protein [Candidatus Heimdallarchaeota archaeon]|nr:DUF4037 domain-containing protein [Candidatus Heimdallarchaeota archaeon]
MDSAFIPGLKLSEMFFQEVVKEIIEAEYPGLKYTAALIGPGSEVIGLDDAVSADHHWGLRLFIFLGLKDYEMHSDSLKKLFRKKLPYEFKGHSTHWSEPDPNDSGTQLPSLTEDGEINHRIEIHTVNNYLKEHLNLENLELTDFDWLLLPEQKLLEFTSGRIFFDTLGDLRTARQYLTYLPDNVWKYKILSEWEHITQEMAFAGRTGGIGDELGSKIESSRLVRYIMRLALLLNKKYIPYPKWFGTTFKKLPIAQKLEPILLAILREEDWKERDNILCKAYMMMVEEQNKLQITPELTVRPKPYHTRNMTVIDTQKVVDALKKAIKPPLDTLPPIGSVDQLLDVGGGLSSKLAQKTRNLFEN